METEVLERKITNFMSYSSDANREQELTDEEKMNKFLDIVSNHRIKFEKLTKMLCDINETTYENINNFHGKYENFLKNFKEINSRSSRILAFYKKHQKIYSALKTALKDFEHELDLTRENIIDIEMIYVTSQNDTELKDLLSKI